MKKLLMLAVFVCSISAWGQSPPPDCSSGFCAGVGTPTLACKAGNKYSQLDAPGTGWSCTGIPPHWVQDAGGGGGGIPASQLALVTAESFGAVGNAAWNGTGTDDTTALQSAINSLQSANICGQVLLQQKIYKITSPLSITKSCVGIKGTTAGGIVGAAVTTPLPSGIVSTSASADIIDVVGTNANARLLYNRFENFAVGRSVAASGTANGISLNYAAGTIMEKVQSFDSIRDFYFHSAPSFSIGHVAQAWAGWGYNGVTPTNGLTYSGYYIDSADGNAQNSLTIDESTATNGSAATATFYGANITGTAINDVDLQYFGTGNMTTGVRVNYTGTGTVGTTSDLQFLNVTNDAYTTNGIDIEGVVGAGAGTVNIVGGYNASATATTGAGILINASSGVSVVNNQLYNPLNNSDITAVNSSYLTFANNEILSYSATNSGVFYSGVTNSSFTGNAINNPTASTATAINIQSSSSYNTFTGNSLGGFASIGFGFDSSSTNNNESGNTINPAHITTAVSDASGTNTPGTPGMVLIASQTLGTTAASITFSSIPGTYRNLRLVVTARTDNTNPNVGFQLNGDTAGDYDWQQFYTQGATVSGANGNASTTGLMGNITTTAAPAGAPGSLEATIYNYAGTTFWKNTTAINGYESATNSVFVTTTATVWRSTAAVTSVKLIPGLGNFVAGSTFTLYGMN